MKKKSILSFSAVALGLMATLATPAFAASAILSGTVSFIKSQDTAVGNTFFQITNTTTVGKCIKDGTSGQTLALIPDNDRGKQMFSTVQAALLAGKSVAVSFDDGGSATPVFCFAKFVSITP